MSATAVPATGAGERMYDLATRLFPLCRSITGAGVRDTLQEVARLIPLEVTEVPSGTPVLDWTIPDEWNIRDAYVARADGTRVVDFRQSNLHVVSYSEPVRATMTLDELRPHLHVHGENPDWVPYRTSYYERTWGFCLSARTLEALDDGPYDVVVDSTLAPGSLTYGECVLPGDREDEVLLSTHVCHPSLANDNLSGIVLLTELAAALANRPRALSYRILFVPGTIGSIAWLARNEERLGERHGRPRRRVRGRTRATDLQAEPARRRARRSRGHPRRRARGRACARLRAMGLGRAAVQLAGLPSPRRLPDARRWRANARSSTPPPTISTSSVRSCSRSRCKPRSPCWTCSSRTARS